jgi:hypothetical protein
MASAENTSAIGWGHRQGVRRLPKKLRVSDDGEIVNSFAIWQGNPGLSSDAKGDTKRIGDGLIRAPPPVSDTSVVRHILVDAVSGL